MSGRSSRAVRQMKMFSASESTQADDRAGALDPGVAEALDVRRAAVDEAHADLGVLPVGDVVVDDHVAHAGGAEVARHLAPHAAVAADDVVVGERCGHAALPAFGEQLPEVARDEQLGDRDQGVEERTDAQEREQDLDDLAAGVRRTRDRPGRRHRVERADEGVPRALVLGDHEARGAQGQQRRDQEAEHPQPAEGLSSDRAHPPGSCGRGTAARAARPARAGGAASSAPATASGRRGTRRRGARRGRR